MFFHILVCFALSVLSSYLRSRSVVKGICLLSCSFVLTQFLLPLLLLAYIFMYLLFNYLFLFAAYYTFVSCPCLGSIRFLALIDNVTLNCIHEF